MVFWTIIFLWSLFGLGWNLYNLINDVRTTVIWWQILLCCLGILASIHGVNGSVRSLLKF